MEINKHAYPIKITYFVKNCIYNCGLGIPDWFDRSLGEISKNTDKQVDLSRPHIFHEVVFPWPTTESAQRAPFCKFTAFRNILKYRYSNFINKRSNIFIFFVQIRSIDIKRTFSRDVHGPIIPWILISFEQLISSVPLELTIIIINVTWR